RKALVSRLEEQGATKEAKALAAMKRPSTVIWAINRLAHEAGDTIEALIQSADRMKAAQLGRHGSGDALSAATARQRELLSDLTRCAEATLREAGVRSSPELLRRIETTVTAAASDKSVQGTLRQGRIERELTPLGFDVFGGVMPERRSARSEASSPATPSQA